MFLTWFLLILKEGKLFRIFPREVAGFNVVKGRAFADISVAVSFTYPTLSVISLDGFFFCHLAFPKRMRGKSWWFLFAAAEMREVLGHLLSTDFGLVPQCAISRVGACSLTPSSSKCHLPAVGLEEEMLLPGMWRLRRVTSGKVTFKKDTGRKMPLLGGFWHLEFLNWLLDMRRELLQGGFPLLPKNPPPHFAVQSNF